MGYREWMSAALAGGLGLAAWIARRRRLPVWPVLDTLLAALAVGVVGGRAAYVGLNWAYFGEHLCEALQWWRGGLMWQAGLACGLAGAVAYARVKRLPVRDILDACTPGLALGCGLGWLACYTASCAYGAPVWPGEPLWFTAADLPDVYGIREPRVAVQWLGMAWAGMSWLLAYGTQHAASLRSKDGKQLLQPGAYFALFMGLYSAGVFALGFVRGDEIATIGRLRFDQAADAVFALVALGYIVYRRDER
ncbi:MAG: prolipoprotein diacylglyceryl transferase [Thermoflexales bacterium]|nr:prolipoprotein diacylglyceryl transferase [Thermoflexales bacterium]